ncbi:MAG: hypothetical protein QM758_19830 [Armatimonas sp.]
MSLTSTSEKEPSTNLSDVDLMPEQDENGIELGYLRENLRLTPAQRLTRAEHITNEILQLRRQMRAKPHG